MFHVHDTFNGIFESRYLDARCSILRHLNACDQLHELQASKKTMPQSEAMIPDNFHKNFKNLIVDCYNLGYKPCKKDESPRPMLTSPWEGATLMSPAPALSSWITACIPFGLDRSKTLITGTTACVSCYRREHLSVTFVYRAQWDAICR
jgi:hypothetical protein